MSFRQRSVTYVKSFLRAFTREKRYPTCFKFRFVSSPLKEWVRFQQAGIDQNENVALCRQQARNGRAFDSVQCPEFEDGGCDGCPGAGDFEILPPVPFSSSSTLSLSGVALLSSTNRVELSGTQIPTSVSAPEAAPAAAFRKIRPVSDPKKPPLTAPSAVPDSLV
jgi:hypothetical protein